MALFPIGDKAKRIIAVVLTVLATIVLGAAQIFGWELPQWATITDVIVLLVAAIFGIEWVPPKKPSNKTGGKG